MTRILDFDPWDFLEKCESEQAAAKPAEPAKETQGNDCRNLAGLATLAEARPETANSPALPEPDPDAPLATWRRYFNSQIRMINRDLAGEGTSLGAELRKFSPPKPKKSEEARRNRGVVSRVPGRVPPRRGHSRPAVPLRRARVLAPYAR